MRLPFLAIALLLTAVAAGPRVDDDSRLVAAAKKEGTVTLYGSMTAPQMQALAQRFQKEYGIHVDTLRLESNALPSRMMIEARAGTPKADVVDEPGFQIDLLKRQGMLDKTSVPENVEMTAGTFDKDGYWSSIFVNTETIAYNPKLLAAAGLRPPTTWQDFTRPEWRGKFAMFNGSYEWYAAMQRAFGKQQGEALARALAANGVKLINSHQLAENMLEAGEYVAAVNTYGYNMARDQAAGLAAVNVNPNPTVVEVHGIGVVAHAPHPNAALLFMRWSLRRDTQGWVASSLGRISARKDVKNNPAIWNPHIHFVISDPNDSANYSDYAKAFNAIFGVAG